MTSRRVLLAAFAVVATGYAAHALPQPTVTRIAYFANGLTPTDGMLPATLRQALRELGYVEGRNVVYISRWADLKSERLPVIARELAEMKPDVVIAFGYLPALAMKAATTTIPIVVTAVGDPVATGLVASFARPGANLTGISDQSAELSGKRLELLKEVRPDASRIAVLWNAGNEAMTQRYREIERAAGALHITVDALAVRDPADFDAAFAAMRRAKPDALLVVTDALTNSNQARVLDFAANSSVPAMYESGPIVRNGGLISYGPRPDDMLRRVAVYVDHIIKGAKPSDLPIEQSTQFELLINMKTAKSLGVVIPNSVFMRADEVIQ